MTITQQQLVRERQSALDRIHEATRKKEDASRLYAQVRRTRDETIPRNRRAPGERHALQESAALARAAAAAAYLQWRTTLLEEHDRELLNPLQIYRQAHITKQMFAKLRQQAAREQTEAEAATAASKP